MKKIFFSLTIIILLVSCSNKNPYTVRHTAVTDTFLNERVCDLPCWQNITPGITSYFEGMRIIKHFNLAENFDNDEPRGSGKYHSTFMWDFINLDPSTVANDEGVFIKEAHENLISSMWFRFPYSIMSLQDFVLIYGEPDLVGFGSYLNSAIPSRKFHQIDLIFNEENTIITVFTQKKRTNLMIDEDVVIIRIVITEKNMIQESYLSSYREIINWEGYGDYAFLLEFE